jgi:hypothetical protein
MRRALLLIALGLATGACDVIEQPSGLIARWSTSYKDVISENDRTRLRDWRKTFESALDEARKSGHSADIAREGSFLDPDVALDGPSIPNGTYRCRVVKLGKQQDAILDYVAYLQRLTKVGGSQRYVGLIFPLDAIREVFLGTLVLGDERRAMQYRQDEKRNVAGYVERIGPRRWRLVMPQPHFESHLDVMELVPEGASD